MAFSYSALNNYGKSTLPSVESFGTNNNIIRDPPKSIMTRRINKISDTNLLNEMIDEAEDRNSECIQRFARGVNPMVNVSYSNGNNMSGKQLSNSTTFLNSQQAYKRPAFDNGAFRPPVRTENQLLPLSRIARKNTSMNINKTDIDYSKKLRECGTDQNTIQVKKATIKTSIRPTKVYKIQRSAEKPSDVKHAIYSRINVSANAGHRTRDITSQHVQTPNNNILNDNIHINANTNLSDLNVVYNTSHMDTERFLQDSNAHSATTNIASNLNISNINDVSDLSNIKSNIQSVSNVNYITNKQSYDKINYIHSEKELQNNLPHYNADTNKSENIYKHIRHENTLVLENNKPNVQCTSQISGNKQIFNNSRKVVLPQTLELGGYNNAASEPLQINTHQVPTLKQKRYNMNKIINQNLKSKYSL